MKKILTLSFLCLVVLSCKPNCELKRPNNIKPIDWENYNDIYTIRWNYISEHPAQYIDMGKDIKVYGWIFQGINYQQSVESILLISDRAAIFEPNPYGRNGVSINVKVDYYVFEGDTARIGALRDSLKTKFATNDITKKCYINGKLSYLDRCDACCYAVPEIKICNADDIYFE